MCVVCGRKKVSPRQKESRDQETGKTAQSLNKLERDWVLVIYVMF